MKGFTLIELLAVIVILAIILLIAMPVVSGVIENAKKETFESSISILKKSATNDYFARQLEDDTREVKYTFNNYVQTVSPADVSKLSFKGKGPKEGFIVISDKGDVEIRATDGKYYIETDSSGNLIESTIYNSEIHAGLLSIGTGVWTGPWIFEVTIPVGGATFSFGSVDTNLTINWGDEVEEAFTYTGVDYITHAYSEGVYNVTVTGTSNHISFCNVNNYSDIWDCPDATPSYLSDILTPIPLSMGLISTKAMFAETNIETFTRSYFFDQASSNVLDMSYMFAQASLFNQLINSWDTSSVIDMNNMFAEAISFNQPLDFWDTSSVTDMSYMFTSTVLFNQPLNSWDISSVINLAGMFMGTFAFDQPLNSWDTTNVTNMSLMFIDAHVFNQPIGAWNTSNVTNMQAMFQMASVFNQPLNLWDTSNVTDMSYMFISATSFNQSLSNWDTSSVDKMEWMFAETASFNQNLSTWCVTNFSSKPLFFDSNASAWVLSRPIWGTCP